jgi:hypothetical protein
MGDVARQQVGGGQLDILPYQDATAALAQRWTPGQLHKRLAALRKLDQLLRTNVNESLALEVTFITAFGFLFQQCIFRFIAAITFILFVTWIWSTLKLRGKILYTDFK